MVLSKFCRGVCQGMQSGFIDNSPVFIGYCPIFNHIKLKVGAYK